MKRILLAILFLVTFAVTAFATVESTPQTVTYNTDGVNSTFSFSFSIDSASDIQVQYDTTVLPSSAYTVACAAWDCSTGGTVTTVTKYALGHTLTITTNIPITQTSLFTENMPALYKTFEFGLDKLTRIDKQLYFQIQSQLSGIQGMVYPSIGIPISTGGSWDFSLAETDGYIPYGASGNWTTTNAPAISAANMTNFPQFNQSTSGSSANVTGTVAIANGGTGATDAVTALNNLGAQSALVNPVTGTGTLYYIPYWTGTGTLGALASVGTSGYVLTSNGAGYAPTFQSSVGAGLSFIDSVYKSGSNISLVNDNAAPGTNMYYGTGGTGVLGWNSLPGAGGGSMVYPPAGIGVSTSSSWSSSLSATAPNFTASVTSPQFNLGAVGATLGIATFYNVTSGGISLEATTGALGSSVLKLPAETGTLATQDVAETLTNKTLVAPLLGTPTSGALTNCTGLPLTTGVTGSLPIANGGTNATTAAGALTNLGAAALNGSNWAFTSQAVGDLPYATSATAYGRLADVAANQPLLSGGTGAAPVYAGYYLSGTAAKTYTFPAYTCSVMPGGDYQITYASSMTANWQNGSTQEVTLTGSPTIAFSNWVNGQVYRLVLVQGGSGSQTVTFSGTIKWQGASAPTLTTTIGASDIITFLYANGVIYASATADFN